MPRTCFARNIPTLAEAILCCTAHLPASYRQHDPRAPFSSLCILFAIVSPPVISSLPSSVLTTLVICAFRFARVVFPLPNVYSIFETTGKIFVGFLDLGKR